MSSSLIGVLDLPGCPSAIAWFVVSVVVDTIQCQVWTWTMPHILKEVFEVISPSFTDFNSTSSVVHVVLVSVAVATIKHGLPYIVFGNVGLPMLISNLSKRGLAGTSTTFRKALSQIPCGKDLYHSAFAAAFPKCCSTVTTALRGYSRQFPKYLSCDVYLHRRILACWSFPK